MDIFSDILPNILSASYSDILSVILSGILSGILSDVVFSCGGSGLQKRQERSREGEKFRSLGQTLSYKSHCETHSIVCFKQNLL